MLLYFKGLWAKKFDKNETYKKDFFEFNNKNPKKVDFMWDKIIIIMKIVMHKQFP